MTIEALLTVAHPANQDAARGLLELAHEALPDLKRFVLVTEGVDTQLAAEPISTWEVTADIGASVADIFTPDEELVFAAPFALTRLIESHPGVVFVDAGCLITGAGGFDELDEVLRDHPMALAIQSVALDRYSTTPFLRVLQDREPISSRVLAVRPGAEGILSMWERVHQECLVDVEQRRPSGVLNALLSSFAALTEVGIGGVRTLMSFRDFSAVASGHSVGPLTPVVDADELWAIARMRSAVARRGGDETLTREQRDDDEAIVSRWLHLLRGSHDSSAVERLIRMVDESVTAMSLSEPTTFDRFAAEIRRSIDPFGHRFPRGADAAFRDWLYERNTLGLTRIAHLWWAHSQDLQDRFPGVKRKPAAFLRSCRRDSLSVAGFDLLDPSVLPVGADRLVRSEKSLMGWLVNALKWRVNTAKLLLPGYGSALRHRDSAAEAIPRHPRPPARRATMATPVLYGSPPRSLSVIGLFRSESGLGQAARSTLQALRLLGRPFTYVDTTEEYLSRNAVDPGLTGERFGATGGVNMIHANADELSTLGQRVFRHRLAGRFNAAMWFWEAGTLPKRAWPAFDVVDELWLASEYLADVFGQYGRVPVKVIGLAAELPTERVIDRAEFGLRDDELVFLFVYDALSAHGRKNPEKAIEAFMRAFGPNYDGVRFVLKVSNLHLFGEEKARIGMLQRQCSALTVFDGYFSRDKVLDLMAASDVYVSLHAAEGFGLTLLEAMAVGTPVICTGYSGNMDFTTPKNSWLVDFDMIATGEPTGPYPIGSVWASPRVDSAVDLMKSIAASPSAVTTKREAAMRDAREAASIERYAHRLDAELRRVL